MVQYNLLQDSGDMYYKKKGQQRAKALGDLDVNRQRALYASERSMLPEGAMPEQQVRFGQQAPVVSREQAPQALSVLAPDRAQTIQKQQDELTRRLSTGVLNSQNPAKAYEQAIKYAGGQGMDTSKLPPSYTPEVGNMLQSYLSQSTPAAESLKQSQRQEDIQLVRQAEERKYQRSLLGEERAEERLIRKEGRAEERDIGADERKLAREEQKQVRTQAGAQRKRNEELQDYDIKKQIDAKYKEPDSDAGQKEFDNATKLRKEFVAQSKDFISVSDAYRRVQASVDNPSAAGDLSLIFNYMKMLDPNSVVRESEFATAASSGSLGQRFVGAGNKLAKGERLSPKMRKDFVDRSAKLYNQQIRSHDVRKDQYGKMAKRFDLDPANVTIDLLQEEVKQEKALEAGFDIQKLSNDDLLSRL